jgi:hypothetical protein
VCGRCAGSMHAVGIRKTRGRQKAHFCRASEGDRRQNNESVWPTDSRAGALRLKAGDR